MLAGADIDTYIGLMHTLFTLEGMYSLKTIGEIDGDICLQLDKSTGTTYASMFDMFHAWQQQAVKLESSEMTKDDYDQWRYNHPPSDTLKKWAKVPSQKLSDYLVNELQKTKNLTQFSFLKISKAFICS